MYVSHWLPVHCFFIQRVTPPLRKRAKKFVSTAEYWIAEFVQCSEWILVQLDSYGSAKLVFLAPVVMLQDGCGAQAYALAWDIIIHLPSRRRRIL